MSKWDNRDAYVRRMNDYKEHPEKAQRLQLANDISTWIVVIAYAALLVYSFVTKDVRLVPQVVLPLVGFVVLSVFRRIVNVKRPYEVYGVGPAIAKDTKGNSFPSRHVFSVVMIAMTLLLGSDFVLAGIAMLALSLFIAYVRISTGVHYLRDVLVGAAFGVVVGLLFLAPIPWRMWLPW